MGVMHIVWSLIVGSVVGLVARAITPGADHIGLVAYVRFRVAGFREILPKRRELAQDEGWT